MPVAHKCERCQHTEESLKRYLLANMNDIIYYIKRGIINGFANKVSEEWHVNNLNDFISQYNSDKMTTIALWSRREGEYYDKHICFVCAKAISSGCVSTYYDY